MSASVPTVSVILPTYNRARLLPRAIASVLGQSFTDFELLVVDDGSTDDTEAVMRGFGDERVKFLPAERNLGDAGARNRAAAVARGDWLAFQDSDDEWLPGKLQRQMDYAGSLPEDFAAVGSTLLRFLGGPVERVSWPLIEAGAAAGEVSRARFVEGFCAYLQSLVVRRSVFAELGGFDTQIKSRSDFDFCLRLSRRYRIAALNEVLALSYETPEGISLRSDYRLADIRYILNSHRDLIEADRRTAARYWYELAKAELVAGDAGAGRRAAWRALGYRPGRPLAWALLALSPFGAGAIERTTRFSQALRQRVHSGNRIR
jgi:glycosyltransferase involved in cell wall biosynthesis